MAKGKGRQPKWLRTGLAAAEASYRAGLKENMADYNVAVSGSAAGDANLSRQLGRAEGSLRSALGANVRAQGNLTRQGRAAQRDVRASQQETTSRYGSVLGASVAQSYGQAGATARATTKTLGGAAAQARGASRVGALVADIARTGAQAQSASAVYSMNQALMARNMVSAETLATLQGQLYQTAISYNMQWEMWKKQQDYAQKQAKKAESAAAAEAARILPELGPEVAQDAYSAYMELDEDERANINVADSTTAWAEANGYDPAGNEAALYARTLGYIKNGYAPDEALNSAIDRLYGNMEGFETWGAPAQEAASQGWGVAMTATFGSGFSGAFDPFVQKNLENIIALLPPEEQAAARAAIAASNAASGNTPTSAGNYSPTSSSNSGGSTSPRDLNG